MKRNKSATPPQPLWYRLTKKLLPFSSTPIATSDPERLPVEKSELYAHMTGPSEKQPWCVILAGPNGAGKSTFYHKVLQNDPMFRKAVFINSDLIGKDIAQSMGKTNSNDYIIGAGRVALNLIGRKLKQKQSFIYETTASGRGHIDRLKEAKANGFKVITIFIGISSVKLAKARVIQRVAEGGHDVPQEVQERRFEKIIGTFPEMLKESDISAVFDNSGSGSPKNIKNAAFNLIFMMDESKNFIFNNYPHWLQTSLKNRKTNKTLIPVYEQIKGKEKKSKNKDEKIWVNKEKFKQLSPIQSTELIRTIFKNFKSSSDR